MNFIVYAILIIGLVLFGILFEYAHILASKEVRNRINKRTTISFDEWFSKNYGSKSASKTLVKDVITIIAKEIGVNATQIKLEDRFDQELAVKGKYRHFLVDDSVGTSLEIIFRKYPFKGKLPNFRTIDDLIQFLSTSSGSPLSRG